eukprot:817869_1
MQCLEQYIWILSDKQLETLKHGQKDIYVMSGQEYHYKMKNNNNAVTFELGIRDMSSDMNTGFMLQINGLSSSSRVSGKFSIAVDELKWVKNGWPFNDLSKG